MMAALILSDVDPVDPDPGQAARLAQMIGLYRNAGLAVDLCWIHDRPDGAPRAAFPEGVRQVALIPERCAIAPWSSDERVHETLAALSAPVGTYAVLHLDRLPLARADGLARTWVFDARDEGVDGDWAGYDLGFCALDAARGALAERCTLALRLPMDVPAPTPAVHSGAIGWAGRWTDDTARGWSETLASMARRGVRLHHDLILAGPGNADVTVPPVLANGVAQAAPVRAALGALGLGVLPQTSVFGHVHAVNALLAAGRPVLLSPQAADLFEDRWQIATCDGPDSMADAIADWSRGDTARDLSEAAARTRAAFVYDIAIMTRHVMGALQGEPVT